MSSSSSSKPWGTTTTTRVRAPVVDLTTTADDIEKPARAKRRRRERTAAARDDDDGDQASVVDLVDSSSEEDYPPENSSNAARLKTEEESGEEEEELESGDDDEEAEATLDGAEDDEEEEEEDDGNEEEEEDIVVVADIDFTCEPAKGATPANLKNDDDYDDEVIIVTDFVAAESASLEPKKKRASRNSSGAGDTTTPGESSNKRLKKSRDDAEVELESKDEPEHPGSAGTAAVKSEPASSSLEEESSDDVMEVASPAATLLPAATPQPATTNNGEEIQVVGTQNQLRLPHMRQHCLVHPYQLNKQVFCEDCFCYVCDVKASECESWEHDHCQATDKGPMKDYWLRQRKERAAAGTTTTAAASVVTPDTTAAAAPAAGNGNSSDDDDSQDDSSYDEDGAPRDRIPPIGSHEFASWLSGQRRNDEPFPPNFAKVDYKLHTKCQHCGWYSKFWHCNFERYNPIQCGGKALHNSAYDIRFTTGPRDWCHACGRVASKRDLGKHQSMPFTANVDSKNASNWILLGEREMKFRLAVHDPRRMKAFAKRWKKHESKTPSWKSYNKKDMEQELFDHRIGAHPTLAMILESLPVLRDIPVDGTVSSPSNPWSKPADSPGCASETEAILLEKHTECDVLFALCNAAPRFAASKGEELAWYTASCLTGDIRANWDRETSTGTLAVRVFVDEHANKNVKDDPTDLQFLTDFLGYWFGALPFSLKDLVGTIRSEEVQQSQWDYGDADGSVSIPPYRLKLTEEEFKVAAAGIEAKKKDILYAANLVVQKTLALSLQSERRGLGGICSNESGFSGALRRHCRELFPEMASMAYRQSEFEELHHARDLGLVSTHRRFRCRPLQSICQEGEGESRYYDRRRSVLSAEENAIVAELYRNPGGDQLRKIGTQDAVMSHLVNLGHAPAPFVQGLTVELLPFQRETLQWCLEREKVPGGIQSFICPKLPEVGEADTELYYNLITGDFSRKKPQLCRGGILAEQMGLGKTVISLALCLSNPAPAFPPSGSSASDLDASFTPPPGEAFWDPVSTNEADNLSSKRGTILSRGTLVICKVSLVGQWIEEAKCRLENPGLVYAYHGASRRRDAHTLAQHAIIVTTYETLVSDNTHHRKKSKDSDYCPPCEKVRWWRIICDESHFLRSKGRAVDAVMQLVGDHKWLVSGTPVNTTLLDLSSQLAFLGIENLNYMFNIFKKSTFRHINDRSASKTINGKRKRHVQVEGPKLGSFMFLMRAVMMRHTQNQKYCGTETTLMSLPPKTERQVVVDWTGDEAAEYQKLEREASEAYREFKRSSKRPVTRHYLKLTAMLRPLRVACAGGRIPLGFEDVEEEVEEEESQDDDDDAPDSDADSDADADADFGAEAKVKAKRNVVKSSTRDKAEADGGVKAEENVEAEIVVRQGDAATTAEAEDGDSAKSAVKNSKRAKTEAELSELAENGATQEEAQGDDDDAKKVVKKKPKRVQVYSEYAYNSKIKRLVEELKKARDGDRTAKSLIFSQFSSTLEWLQKELPNHGFEFRTLTGDMTQAQRAKALRDFQNDPPTTIFLLSMRAGAVGINLTEANRVFIMEPCFNPALEAQAVGRVHRLGQKRPVEITRFVMADSVETRIQTMLKAKYGHGTENHSIGSEPDSDENGDAETDVAKKPPAAVAGAAVGSLRSDKAKIVVAEMDLLFAIDKYKNGAAHATNGDATEESADDQHGEGSDQATVERDVVPEDGGDEDHSWFSRDLFYP